METRMSTRDDAGFETWAPLVEDDLDAVRNAAVTVDHALEAECPEAGELG